MDWQLSVRGIIGIAIVSLGLTGAYAADVPKSGDFRIHTGMYFTGTVTPVGENRMYASGPYWGVSFNDSGDGFLHHAAWNCPGISDIANGAHTSAGHCTVTDGSRGVLRGDWTGGGKVGEFEGAFTFTSGEGGYAGISGGLEFKCLAVSQDGRQLECHQWGHYKLP